MTLLALPYDHTQAPLDDAVLLSRQGQRTNAWHHGTDWGVAGARSSRGATIFPVMPGVVEAVCLWPAECCGGYGNTVLVRHGDDLLSFYAHLNRVDVVEGQDVAWDTPLGIVGNTFADFRTAGCPRRRMASHLHLEIRYDDGSRYDVLQVLAAGGLGIDEGGLLTQGDPFDYEEPRLADAAVKADTLPEVIVGDPALLQDEGTPPSRCGIGWPVAVLAGAAGFLVGWLLKGRRCKR